MAAPNIAGPEWASDHDDQTGRIEEVGVARGSSPEEQARLRQIAELAERLAVIERRDRRQSAARETSPDVGTDSPASAFAGATERRPNERRSNSYWGGSGGRPASQTGAIGSSGSSRTNRDAGQEPGGHSGDDKGDPEAVAKAICLRLLTGAARPRAGLATALRQRGIPDEVANRVLDRFEEVGLIDDVAYAEAFVAAKHRERALGVSALRMELRRKGVDDQTVDAAVGVLDHDAERQRAQTLISRRVDSAMSNGPVAARRRLVALLARRGYSAELAGQVVDAALAEYGEEQDDSWSN